MTNTNGIDKKAAWKNIRTEWGGIGLAEFVSMGTSLGVVAVADTLAPNLINKASKALAKVVFEPYLDGIEKFMGKVCRLDECKPDMTKTREERAERLAHTTVLFASAWAASMTMKIATRRIYNKSMGIKHVNAEETGNWFKDKILYSKLTPHDLKLTMVDEAVHLGAFFMVNAVFHKQADAAVIAGTKMLQNTLNLSEEKAKNVATMAVVWETPNLLGLVSGGGVAVYDGLHPKKIISTALQGAHPHTP